MNVSVGANWEAFIASLVKEGRYASATEIMREGLRLVQEREEKRKALRETIERAVADPRRYSAAEVTASLDAKHAAMKLRGL